MSSVFLRSAGARLAPHSLALLAAACGRSEPTSDYAFFVAGHVYGHPKVHAPGLHPPFAAKLDWLARVPGMAFGVLLGDSVFRPTEERWNALDRDLARFPFPMRLAVGNHDIRPQERAAELPDMLGPGEYVARYGPTFYSFTHGPDLFVVLDANPAEWNIAGEQLEFLRGTLAEHADARQVFVFCHQVIWWRPEEPATLVPNSSYGRAQELTYWSVLEPLFQQQSKPVFLFAGDVGASEDSTPFAFSRTGDVQRIATGMGAGERDNCVVVQVPRTGRPRLRLVALAGDDPDALGPLEVAGD